jgi:hypothetical protein
MRADAPMFLHLHADGKEIKIPSLVGKNSSSRQTQLQNDS